MGGASPGLEDLQTEVCHFNAIMEAVRKAPWGHTAMDAQLKQSVNAANKALDDIEYAITYRFTKPGEPSRVDHLQWVRSGSYIEKLAKNLKQARTNISVLLDIENR